MSIVRRQSSQDPKHIRPKGRPPMQKFNQGGQVLMLYSPKHSSKHRIYLISDRLMDLPVPGHPFLLAAAEAGWGHGSGSGVAGLWFAAPQRGKLEDSVSLTSSALVCLWSVKRNNKVTDSSFGHHWFLFILHFCKTSDRPVNTKAFPM